MVALYCRVSTQEQAINGHSLNEQMERLQKYSEAMCWQVCKVYSDAGFSGATIDRPALQELIRDAKSRRIDKILVYKLDRLSRSQKNTLFLIEDIFIANSVDFISISENFDTSTSLGRAMIGILAVFAQLEREQIKERMKMGHEARAKEGLYNGGRQTPTGYNYAEGQLIPDAYEAIQVKEIYKLALEGKPASKIADSLNEKGFMHKCGKWSENTVKSVLKSRLYIGEIRYGGKWYQGKHEPLITKEVFDKVSAIIENRSEAFLRYNRRAGKSTTYLGGLLICGCCGAKYAKLTSDSMQNGKLYKYSYYACNSQTRRRDYLVKDPNCRNRRWKMECLDEIIFNEIKKLSLEPEELNREYQQTDDNQLNVIKTEIKKISEKISRLLDLYSDGKTPLDVLQDKIEELNNQKLSLEEEVSTIENASISRLSRKAANEISITFSEIISNGDLDEIKTIIESLIEKIELDGDSVRIFWKFS